MTSEGGKPPSPRPTVQTLLADQNRRSLAGESFRVEDYFGRHPWLADDTQARLDLIDNEYLLRKLAGESPTLVEYQARFPDLTPWLADVIQSQRALESGAAPPGPPVKSRALVADWPEVPGYEILGVLGSGGMGVVYRCRDRRRGITVAVKTMRQGDPAAIYRFKQEFRALLDVSHPNLITLHELISDGQAWFIVMEYIEGVNFLEHVRNGPTTAAFDQDESIATNVESTSVDREPSTMREGPRPEESRTVRVDESVEVGLESHVDSSTFRSPIVSSTRLGPEALIRLRRSLAQAAEGLQALHQAGKLHRDIKPSNIMVKRDGRVMLLDFGLIASTNREGRDETTENSVVGTAAYMAPEQATEVRLTEAADWYSVGVMIYEALTGRRPHLGGSMQVLIDKQRIDPTPPNELVLDVPDDLNTLCVELLRRDPCTRPLGREVLSRLGSPSKGSSPLEEPSSTLLGGELPFVGRVEHRAALAEAREALRGGSTVVVFVQGKSGFGKSALIQRFLDGLIDSDDAVVLSGRCYERESVPYKALDSLIDAFSHYLRRLPQSEAAALLPRDVGPLVRVFPVLQRVEAVGNAPRRTVESPDPQELRRRAYSALRELLARLGDRRPLVLAIDDFQWGDADSLGVLAEILRPPDPPVLLLLVSYRSEDAAENLFLRAALGFPGAAGLDRRELTVGPLAFDEARTLAFKLLGSSIADPESKAEAIARESGGNPMFVAELVRSVQADDHEAGIEPSGLNREPIVLDEVLWSRILRLPDEAQRLLEIVAVSGGPLRLEVAWRCHDRAGDERATVSLLRSSRLVRGSSKSRRSTEEWVETYHDRVRETVVAHLAPESLREIHRRLARALEASRQVDPEVLGVHFQGAGELERAGEQFTLAAGRAAETLAFGRAAGLYRLALELLPRSEGRDRRLHSALAEALANAGRGAEAAREYLAASTGATVAEALDMRRRAAMQFLISGHIDEGLDALRDVLQAVGLPLLRDPRLVLVSLLYRRARLRLRGIRFRPRDPSQIAPADLTRIDVCWSAGLGLSNVDWIRGADFQARGLLFALKAGEPYRIARALTLEAAHSSTAGRTTHKRTQRLLDTAAVLARTTNEPYALGMVTLATGVSAYLETRWADALEASDNAGTIFRDRCTGVAWELDTTHAYALWALSHLGRWAELARRFPVLISEAKERGDLYAVMNLSTYILSVVRLAADEPEAAREETDRVMSQWSRQGYHVQHNDQVWAAIQIDLYLGEGANAWKRITEHWPTLSRSLLMNVQFIRVAMWGLRARCALSARTDGSCLRVAARDASRLEREGITWASAQARLIRAGIAAIRGERVESTALLTRAAEEFRRCEMSLCAAAADRRLGELLDSREGQILIDKSDHFMNSQSIQRPDRITALFAPGFR